MVLVRTRALGVGLVLTLFLAGCAGGPETTTDPGVAHAPPPVSSESSLEKAKRGLLARSPRSASEELALADVNLQLGDAEGAIQSFRAVKSAPGATQADRFAAAMRLGEVHLSRNEGALAAAVLSDAEKDAHGDFDRERAMIQRARAHIMKGDAAGASWLRKKVKRTDVPELASLDQELRGARFSSTPSESRTTESVTDFGTGAPEIISRAKWGAKRINLRGDPQPLGTPTRVTWHHTADVTPYPDSSFAENAERLRAYQSTHQNDRRWADLGYHFVIDRQGRIFEGRELKYQGAHAGNPEANEKNVGIAMMGNFENSKPSSTQKEAIGRLTKWLCAKYRIPASRIYGHDEVFKKHDPREGTNCPGKHLEAYLAEFKRAMPGRGTRSGAARTGRD